MFEQKKAPIQSHPSTEGVGQQIQTKEVQVLITTDDLEVNGFMHVKPGGYQSRLSDLLNGKDIRYIPITNATFRKIEFPDEPPRKVDTIILRLDTVKTVIPFKKKVPKPKPVQ